MSPHWENTEALTCTACMRLSGVSGSSEKSRRCCKSTTWLCSEQIHRVPSLSVCTEFLVTYLSATNMANQRGLFEKKLVTKDKSSQPQACETT